MLTRRTALGALLSPLVLAGCGFGGGESYRYRMTVVVDTPQGPRTGSSVIEVRGRSTGPLAASAFTRRARGEAVFVDLPGGHTLFALLSSPSNGYDAAGLYPVLAYESTLPPGHDWHQEFEGLKREREPALLPSDAYPRLITFRDPKDAKSIEVVDPADLAAVFGPGIALKNIEIAITSDPVTKKLSSRLPDFGPSSGYVEWASQLPSGDPRSLSLDELQRDA
ncbi:MAG: hypothetical protein QOE79_1941 [Sphingomonadales bacterium]|nr:hypothetical protein [Sphingomonadales bacterium]